MVVSVIAERVPFWNPIAAAYLADVIAGSDRTVILLNGADRPISAHLQPFTVDVQKEMLTLLFPRKSRQGSSRFRRSTMTHTSMKPVGVVWRKRLMQQA